MNIFELVLKQMRQRALGTWLTLLSVTLGVALAIAIILLRRESGALFGQKDYGYDIIIGKKGSATQLVMNTVYHLDVSPGNVPYSLYREMLTTERPLVRLAVPYVVGDSYQGRYPFVGTVPSLFGYGDDGQKLDPEKVMEYRPDKRYELAEGHDFVPEKFQAVIGSDIAKKTDLKMGSVFQATHGFPRPGETPDIHPEKWVVVGVLKPTHTAADVVVYIPHKSLYTIGDHAAGLKAQWYIANHLPPPPQDVDPDSIKAYTMNPDGTFNLLVPEKYWEISAILVKSRGSSGYTAQTLMYNINNGNEAMAVNPASVMRQFFDQFLSGPTLVLLLIAGLVSIVAAVGILVSIYNSVSARLREIAILRALGATRARILTLICVESGLIGLFGGIAGLIAGHLLGAVGSFYFNRVVGQGINWIQTDRYEWYYVAAVVVVALIAGLVPAMKAYRTPVATNLVAV